MIAASDPQEFIPSGRQQITCHPNALLHTQDKLSAEEAADCLLSHKFEKVSIRDSSITEQWKLRESPNFYVHKKKTNMDRSDPLFESNRYCNISDIISEDSWHFKSAVDNNFTQKTFGHISELTTSKINKNRSKFSNESEYKPESKSGSNTFKSRSSIGASGNAAEFFSKQELSVVEEELYVKGRTAVWSKGLSYSNTKRHNKSTRSTLCCYTATKPIKHAIWCTFHVERPDYNVAAHEKPDEPTGSPLPCICIIDTQNIQVFSLNNEDFISSLPFQVSNIWCSKFGVLLEKEISTVANDDCFNVAVTESPVLFSFAHPLDEMCPVAIRHGNFQLLTDVNVKVVFTIEEPSIVMVYNKSTEMHGVYRLRRVKCDEWFDTTDNNCSTSCMNPSILNVSNKLMNKIASGKVGLPVIGSPYSSRTTTPLGSHGSRPHSPMAAISRANSPGKSPLVAGNPWIRPAQFQNSMDQTELQTNQIFYHLNPELCLEHIWTSNIRFPGAASRVFLSTDFVGQTYLCFLVPSSMQFYLTRYDIINNSSLIFGVLTNFPAKDAVSLPHCHMISVLEPNGNIVLYSGLTVVGKVNVGGMLTQHAQSPYVIAKLPRFATPFPRRSTLVPYYDTPPNMDPAFDEHLLSPVHPAQPNNDYAIQNSLLSDSLADQQNQQLIGLRDPVGSSLTLEYSNNVYYRISLPVLASTSLVQSCLEALRQTLPKEQAIMLFTNFYAARNAPGPDELNMEKEWNTFTNILYTLLGYSLNEMQNEQHDCNFETPLAAAKRQRPSTVCSDKHWQNLLQSEQHKVLNDYVSYTICLKSVPTTKNEAKQNRTTHINETATLYPYIKIVHFTLHLLHEELCLNTLRQEELQLLAQFLIKLSSDLMLKTYEMYYLTFHPTLYRIKERRKTVRLLNSKSIITWPAMNSSAVSFNQYICDMMRGSMKKPYSYVRNVNPKTRDIIMLCALIVANESGCSDYSLDDLISVVVPPGTRAEPQPYYDFKSSGEDKTSAPQKVVNLMTKMGITRRELDTLPFGINLLLHGSLWECRENPPSNWTADAYYLIQRPELASLAQLKFENKPITTDIKSGAQPHSLSVFAQFREVLPNVRQLDAELDDGMENIENRLLRLRFPEDQRVTDVRRLLQSSEPAHISITQRPDVSDHDFIEEQEKHLYAICTRTMALPVGRGMFALRTATPVITETLPVARLSLSGRAPPRGAAVELTHIDTPPNMNLWPLFHNGVAAGLRISPDAPDIDSTWIVFNKPKSTSDTPLEHAGFLMALGLNGHLKNLAVLNTYDYLSKFHEMTSVGLLLGLSAAKRGTMDVAITKMLSIHLEALLPPTSMEMDISQNLQVAALLGVGLLYQGSAHRHISEVLLAEIGRPPGPEMENSTDRESYSLAAGLALGLVTLCRGDNTTGLADLAIPDTLHYYIVGGNKRQWTGSQKDKYKVPSFQIREGSSVNLDITAPGAILALGLMYMGSGNKAVAGWMNPPDTQYLLDFVRPDFLMLQIIARALIMWNDIEPTKDWITEQVPEAIRPFCLVKPTLDMDSNIDFEAMNQAYSNIIAGACFAMGLKYAGSGNDTAFKTLLHYCHMFTSLTGKSIAELAGKPTIEMCLNLVLLSVSMVMAGTGSLEIMRIIRYLRKRVGVASSAVVTYGSHLAVHMALGLLFLGGGRYTLSNSPPSIAALICAFFPKFPTHSNDNRYHLQAFRHLYVLAVEPRLLIPRDVLTGRMCYADLKVVHLNGDVLTLKGPCLIPDLNTLSSVSVQDKRYWPVVFEKSKNWDQLINILEYGGHVEVKQRAGCLSYIEDPFGWQSELARAITKSRIVPWEPQPTTIATFTSEISVRFFIANYITNLCTNDTLSEIKLLRMLAIVTYECLTKDKVAILPLWITLIKVVDNLSKQPSVFHLCQVKLVLAQMSFKNTLIPPDMLFPLKQQVMSVLTCWEKEIRELLASYVGGNVLKCSQSSFKKLATYVSFYDVPFDIGDFKSNFELLLKLKELNINEEAAIRVMKIAGVH